MDSVRSVESPELVKVGDLVDGRYRIEGLIARGGQAAVWKASQEPLQRPVALKVLTAPPQMEESEPFQERFLLEAKTLAALDHPNIVTVHDYGEIKPGSYYIAMEYIDGRRFSELLRERPLDPRRFLRLIYQVCSALRYAHQRGVIHRDVKNANLLIRRDPDGRETVKVVDFGIVKLMEADPGITQEGVVLGSPHFMAPEQVKGAFFDHRADIYAVGVLLYCGSVGRYPFRGPDARSIMSAHLLQPLPPIAIRDPRLDADEEFKDILRRCLAKDPEDRFPDMEALMAALQPYVEGERLASPELIHEPAVLEEVELENTMQTELGAMALYPLHEPDEEQHTIAMDDMAVVLVDEESSSFGGIHSVIPDEDEDGEGQHFADVIPTSALALMRESELTPGDLAAVALGEAEAPPPDAALSAADDASEEAEPQPAAVQLGADAASPAPDEPLPAEADPELLEAPAAEDDEAPAESALPPALSDDERLDGSRPLVDPELPPAAPAVSLAKPGPPPAPAEPPPAPAEPDARTPPPIAPAQERLAEVIPIKPNLPPSPPPAEPVVPQIEEPASKRRLVGLWVGGFMLTLGALGALGKFLGWY